MSAVTYSKYEIDKLSTNYFNLLQDNDCFSPGGWYQELHALSKQVKNSKEVFGSVSPELQKKMNAVHPTSLERYPRIQKAKKDLKTAIISNLVYQNWKKDDVLSALCCFARNFTPDSPLKGAKMQLEKVNKWIQNYEAGKYITWKSK